MMIRRTALTTLLLVTLALTGVALGAARGHVRAGQSVVLCSGAAVTVTPGEAGGPGHVGFCPDMATGLLAAIGGGVGLPALRVRAARPLFHGGAGTPDRGRRPARPRARGPPAGLARPLPLFPFPPRFP